jgi:sporulation protein YlmC with PRC-barrel domain
MEIKVGANVLTAQAENVGRVERIVLDPQTKAVTHLVVRHGLLNAVEKVVPLNLVVAARDEAVQLSDATPDLQTWPDFQEEHYIIPDSGEFLADDGLPFSSEFLYAYPPRLNGADFGQQANAGFIVPGYKSKSPVVVTERTIPEENIALKHGAKVIARDGKHVGNVERVVTENQTDTATHFLISKGLFLKERKFIPTSWINTINDHEVHLAIGSRLLSGLPDYHEVEAQTR